MTGSERSDLSMPSAADMCLRHVAIIMDGNGRWAQARGLPRHEGHRAGVESARSVIEAAARAGVEVLTLYSFSTENWKRPAEEVAALMGLITHLLPIERETLMENGIRFRVIGDLARLPQDVVSELEQTQSATAGNSGMQLVVALNYGSRQEIVHAVQTLAASVQAGDRTPESIDAEAIADALWTKGLPDVDLLIRTAGEMRVSNYLLWQISYAEIVVDECCWPDFGAEGFTRAMEQFAQRRRTRGGLSADG